MLKSLKSKLLTSFALVLLLGGTIWFAVSSNAPVETAPTTITAAGSTSVQPILEMLSQEYMVNHRDIRINVQGGGSSAGVKAAQTGTSELGMASRELKSSEKGLWEFVLAYDGIAVIVHPNNRVTDLTVEQIKQIFSGEISDWSQLGGSKGKINVVNREAGSGTRGAFEEIVLAGKEFVEDAIIQGSTGAVKTTVASDPNAIGYISLASVDKQIKALLVNGVVASADNIGNKTYPTARPFNLLAQKQPTGVIGDFITWLRSEEAVEIIMEEGLVPVK